MKTLLTATQLGHWADERRSQDMLPLLIRRLILGTINPLEIDFPSGDSINRPGYDGFLRSVDGGLLIPAGQSVWEMGVGDPAEKANSDYADRKADPLDVIPTQTTFVFVTPRRWKGKKKWAAKKRAENFWRDVNVLDGVDLEQWLDRCPPTAAWACRQIICAPEDICDIEEVWESWTTRTAPPLVPGLFTAGRAAQADIIRQWFTNRPSCLRVRADTVDEGVGFIAAVTRLLDEPTRELIQSRAVVIKTPDSWRAISSQNTPLILITTSSFGTEPQAIARGHRVAIIYGNDSAGISVDVQLSHLRRPDLDNALRQMGLEGDRCFEVAAESRGRISAIVDLLGGGTSAPRWASPVVAPELVPFLLAGSWCENSSDTAVMAKLARISVDEMSKRLSHWANETDPPIRLVGGTWEWISRQRAWPHLARHVTTNDLNAYFDVVRDVLGEIDPRLALSPDQRWMASLYNSNPKYSDLLRRGLAESLVMLSVRADAIRTGTDVVNTVNAEVRNLFGQSPDPQRWYSLASILPLLAEAAPSVFLTSVTRDVIGNGAVLTILFQEKGFFGGSRHCHLLWALETLAWMPEHVTQVAVVLAGLTEKDPGGKTGNRPCASLTSVFLPWYRGTDASVTQRLAAIDAINRQYPNVSFKLGIDLLNAQAFATPTARPRWRVSAGDGNHGVPIDEYQEYVLAMFDRTLKWAQEDCRRWAKLLEPGRHVGQEALGKLFTHLEDLPLEQMANPSGDVLRRAVRRILHQKMTIAKVYPDITDEFITRLNTIYARLEPSDPVLRDAWIFDRHPDLLSTIENDWKVQLETCESERHNIIADFVTQGRRDELLRLADAAEIPYAVGYHIGQSQLSKDHAVSLLLSGIDSGDGKRAECARGIIWGKFRRDGWHWIECLFSTEEARQWLPLRKSNFALALPVAAETWDWIETLGGDVAAEYWKTAGPWLSNPQRDTIRAINSLLNCGRPFAALTLAQGCVSAAQMDRDEMAKLCLAVLRRVTAVACGNVPATEVSKFDSGTGYGVSQMLTVVDAAKLVSEQELAQMEWVWLPLLEHTERGIATLNQMLVRDAAFFAQCVAYIYRPDNSSAETNELEKTDKLTQTRITQVSKLLGEWREIPGRNHDGTIDAEQLRKWVIDTRHVLTESGHAEIGDDQIGKVLSRVPVGTDGVWPHDSIRNLIEDLQSDAIEAGIYFGRINGRGVTVRSPYDGGKLEVALADKYAADAVALVSFPRIAKVLRELAKRYRQEARRQDDHRDLGEFHR